MYASNPELLARAEKQFKTSEDGTAEKKDKAEDSKDSEGDLSPTSLQSGDEEAA